MAALGGCTAMDVISILRKKRQAVTGYEVEVVGERRTDQHPKVFTRLEIVHRVRGPRPQRGGGGRGDRAERHEVLLGARHAGAGGRHHAAASRSRRAEAWTSFRIEKDSMGEMQVPADALLRAADPARGRELPGLGRAHAAGVHPRARPGQAGGGAGQRELGLLDAARSPAPSSSAAREVAAGTLGRRVPDRRLPDRQRHQHEHERQRGHRPAAPRRRLGPHRCTPTTT